MKSNVKTIAILFLINYSIISAQDTLKIKEAVITGNRIEVARKNIPLTISIIKDDAIEESTESAILPFISKQVPGLFVTEKGITGFGVGNNSSGQISIRGIGGAAPNTQVLVLVDGHPQYMGIFGHPIPDAYVASDVEKVEVIRGPASILYGSNAMGGVINVITKQQKSNGYSLNARYAYGSFNTQKQMVSGGFKKNKFNVFASINHDKTDGHRDNSNFNITNGFVKTGFQINKHFKIIADFNIADFKSTDPGIDTNELSQLVSEINPSSLQKFSVDILRGKTSVAIQNKFAKFEGGMITFYNFGEHNLSDGWHSKDANKGITLYQGLRLFQGNLLTMGIDYKNFGGEGNGGMAANTWNSIDETAGYLYIQQILLEKLVISSGYRLENNSKYGIENVPQVGISYHLNELTTLKTSVSKGFRSPTVMETYLFMPNPNLEPERLTNCDFSIYRSFYDNKINTELTAYYIKGSNVIQLVPNDNAPPPMKRDNIGSFNHKGIELSINYNVNNSLIFTTNYSYLDISKPKLAAPKNKFYFGGNYTINKIKINMNVQHISGLYTYIANNSNNKTESYTLVDLKTAYMPVNNIEIFIAGKNMLNQEYKIYDGYLMPGINIMGGIHFSFSK
ncbi:TonB-dependent receptor plug domain-containing protein [Bacteroidota bacterium]